LSPDFFHIDDQKHVSSMSARPPVLRPITQHQPPNSARQANGTDIYISRNQFTAIKNSRESLTTDDITNLKREKQNLIQERSLLKARLARYANFNRHPKPPGRNQHIANSLEQQVRTLEQLTAAKRAEIAQLIYSDRAAVISELQEESKMLHLELMRLRKSKQESEASLRDVTAQLKEACEKYSPAVLARQDKTIKNLEREIAAQRAKNDTIKEKVAQMKAEQEDSQYQEQNMKVHRQIDSLRSQIKQEQQEIAAIDQQMAQMKADHAAEMTRLQSDL
jgi:vacuolar-type H+-ATPase subunit I/STV1